MAKLLLFFVTHPWEPVYVRELRRLTGLGMGSLQAELKRLEALGVLTRTRRGNRVLYEVEVAHAAWKALRALVAATATPAELLRAAFAGVEGVEAAFVFGSEARGDTRPDSDIDLFIVGREDVPHQARDALLEFERLVGRDLDLLAYTPGQVTTRSLARSGFLSRVRGEPKLWLFGDERVLAQAAEAAA